MSESGKPVDVGEFVLHGGSTADVLASPSPGRPQVPPLLRKLLVNVAAIASVLAVVVAGGGAIVVYRTLSGGGPQPDKYAPASTFAFAKVDLDPSAGEKIAAYRFIRKFPGSATNKTKNADDIRDRLLDMLFKDSSDPHVDYKQDIKPWLGARVGIAGFMDASHKPEVLGIVAVKDVAKARTSLARIRAASEGSAFAYDVKKDYALLAPGKAVINDANAQLTKGNLAKSAHFRSDTQRLGGGQILTAWADLDAVQKVSGSLFEDIFGTVVGGELGLSSPPSSGSTFTPSSPRPSAMCVQQFQRILSDSSGNGDPLSKLSPTCRREFGTFSNGPS